MTPRTDRHAAQIPPTPWRRRAIGRIPIYGVAPAAAAPSDIGYDSLNRKRKKPKLYPGAPKPKKPVGPGSTVAGAAAATADGAAVGQRQQGAGGAVRWPAPSPASRTRRRLQDR